MAHATPSSGIQMSVDCLGFLPGDHVIQAMETELLTSWGISVDLHQGQGPKVNTEVKTKTNATEISSTAKTNDEISSQSDKEETSKAKESKDGTLPTEESSTAQDTENKKQSNGVLIKEEPNELDEKAKALFEKAKQHFEAGEFCESLIYIDDIVEKSDVMETNVDLLTLKAKALNSMGDHREALRVICTLPLDKRQEEAWLEGANALWQLELPVTAEVWLKKALLTSLSTSKDGNKTCPRRMVHLLQTIRTHRVYKPLVQGTPVSVKFTEHNGRELRASKTIEKGATLFSETPEVLEQSIASHRYTACDHCARSLLRPNDVFRKEHLANAEFQKALKRLWPTKETVPCRTCDRVVYCSEECRRDAWDSYHQVICPSSPDTTPAMLYDVRKSFRDVIASDGSSWQGWWNAEFSPIFMAKIWACTMCHAKRLAKTDGRSTTTKSDWFTAGATFEKYSTSRGDAVTDAIPRMYELMHCLFRRSKVQSYEVTEKNFNRRYLQIITNYTVFYDVNDPLRKFVDKVTKDPKMYKKIGRYFHEPLPKAEFHGLFALSSCINHNCLPNAKIVPCEVQGHPGIKVVALTEIKEGEAITVSYVDSTLPKKDRKRQLWKRYQFLCHCLRCDYEGDYPEICTHCGKRSGDPEKSDDTSESTMANSGLDPVADKALEEVVTSSEPKPQPVTDKEANQNNNSEAQSVAILHEKSEEAKSAPRTEVDQPSCSTETKSPVDEADAVKSTSTDSREKVDQETEAQPQTSDKIDNTCSDNLQPDVNSEKETAGQKISSSATATAAKDAEAKPFPACSKCKRAWYCSQKCQKLNWKHGHKKICAKVQQKAASV